ncbi:DNA polymerase III subunit beta [Candidatus Endowatersipora endosymbiont of Watersipora subatra]|uniref:DNA polymerase III subunit beta n=1 Tax=Candidatus Endowatersipora endosymbiont of Watersipora subatra TaxID=3077946 RepID=UPI00312C8CAB
MRLVLERSNLLKSLSHIQRVVERRNTIMILSHVLLKAEHDSLNLKATNLDIEITENIPALVEQNGSATLSAHMLYGVVRKLSDQSEVSIFMRDDKNLYMAAGRSQFQFKILSESEFPDLTAGEFSHVFRIDSADFKELISDTQFSMSTEETRHYLNGVYLHCAEESGNIMLRSIATDGHRLAQAQTQAPDGADGMPGVIIPRKTVCEVQRLLENSDSLVKIELSDTKIRFTFGSIVLTSKLIDGTFPDYNRVIPVNNDKEVILDRKLFATAVDRVSTITSDLGRVIKLSLTKDNLRLSANNPDSGSAEEEISVQYSSHALDIGFNSKYLLDILNQMSSNKVRFMFFNSGSPTLIQEKLDARALYVLMPMRV